MTPLPTGERFSSLFPILTPHLPITPNCLTHNLCLTLKIRLCNSPFLNRFKIWWTHAYISQITHWREHQEFSTIFLRSMSSHRWGLIQISIWLWVSSFFFFFSFSDFDNRMLFWELRFWDYIYSSWCFQILIFGWVSLNLLFMCRTLQSIWRHYILNIVSVETAAYTKVQLQLACFVIHG